MFGLAFCAGGGVSMFVILRTTPGPGWRMTRRAQVALTERQENFFDDKSFEKSRQQIYRAGPLNWTHESTCLVGRMRAPGKQLD